MLIDRKVNDAISRVFRDPELLMELNNQTKKELAQSLKSKKRISFIAIQKKYGLEM